MSSFSVNNIALVNGRPEMLNLKDMIHHFVDHRHEVVVRRTKYELKKAEDRAHIVQVQMQMRLEKILSNALNYLKYKPKQLSRCVYVSLLVLSKIN